VKEMEKNKLYNNCLIVVDMVNGFVREGDLHDENIAKIIPVQVGLIKEAQQEDKLIVFIKDTHNLNSVEFKRFGGQHCIEGTYESELVDELKRYENLENAVSIMKNSTSFMEAPQFRELIQNQINLKNFEIVGCCTDICVVNGAIGLANYLDQWNREHDITVYQDAIATYFEAGRQEYVQAAELLMKQQGINYMRTRNRKEGRN
jgi:nicotinamidase-related amidase